MGKWADGLEKCRRFLLWAATASARVLPLVGDFRKRRPTGMLERIAREIADTVPKSSVGRVLQEIQSREGPGWEFFKVEVGMAARTAIHLFDNDDVNRAIESGEVVPNDWVARLWKRHLDTRPDCDRELLEFLVGLARKSAGDDRILAKEVLGQLVERPYENDKLRDALFKGVEALK